MKVLYLTRATFGGGGGKTILIVIVDKSQGGSHPARGGEQGVNACYMYMYI